MTSALRASRFGQSPRQRPRWLPVGDAITLAEARRTPPSLRQHPVPAAPAALPPLRSSGKISSFCVYRVVWCPQYKTPVITGKVEQRLREIVAEVLADKEARLIAIELAPRYVHLVVEVGPQLGIHRLVKAIKARSASALREEFPSLRSRLPSLWTNSYLVTTVGNSQPAPLIQGFLAEQRTR